ncbi:capsule assembly Wzi family protein [Larkinella bovis]|uniref:Capsule assembly Wzi family protein n=1 Tax=Larkinella bovis TaxID=683041 RepID=A0ABW0I5Q6_9BACT
MGKTFLTLFAIFLGELTVFGQDSIPALTVPPKPPFQLFAEVSVSASTARQTPFWLRANRFGIVPTTSPFISARVGVSAEYQYSLGNSPGRSDGKRKRVAWGYGLEVVGNGAAKAALLVPEAYLKGRYQKLELRIGRHREVIGLADSTLGTGSYSWSGNALPMPKIQLSLADYAPIGFTKGLVAFRGLFAHGWFGNNGVVTHSYLHQKALYGRLGKAGWPVKLYAGFNHQVQWAGRSDGITDDRLIKNGRFPTGFRNYLNVMFGTSLAARGEAIDTTEYSKSDRGNRVGNHLGTVDIGLEIHKTTFSILVYRQNIYEDGSLYYLTNIADGLNGIRFKNKNPAGAHWHFQTILFELLVTKSQGGSVFSTVNKKRGADNYFNHSQYLEGWSYRGRTIGTPFIPPAGDTNPDLPRLYSEQLPVFTNNNRVRVFHWGMEGTFDQRFVFQLKGSLSESLGTYSKPFGEKIRQFSSLLTLRFPVNWLGGVQATVAMASDFGGLYPRNTGFHLSLRKDWMSI